MSNGKHTFFMDSGFFSQKTKDLVEEISKDVPSLEIYNYEDGNGHKRSWLTIENFGEPFNGSTARDVISRIEAEINEDEIYDSNEDERMMDLVNALQGAMLEGTDADAIEGLPAPNSEKECWEDALGYGDSQDVVICWQEPHGYHFRDRSDAIRHDAECVDTEETVVDGYARPIYATVECFNFNPENACQSHVAISGVWIGNWEGEKVEIPRDEDDECEESDEDDDKEPACIDDEGHQWVQDDHSQTYGSTDVYRLTGYRTAPYGTDNGHHGASICRKCGVVNEWRYFHGGFVKNSYSPPDSDLVEKLKEYEA